MLVKRLHLCYTISENVLDSNENVIDWKVMSMFFQYQTAKDASKKHQLIIKRADKFDMIISIDLKQKFQRIIGFGGAFTEAAAYTLSKVDIATRQKVIDYYFDKDKGLGYTIGRVHINSCDFSLENYDYVDEYDIDLSSFNIERELKYVIPLIKDSENALGQSIALLASPWSPPAWMKTNYDMNHGGKLLPKYYEVWSNYYVKFIEAYKKHGLNIEYITVQNEPAAKQIWDSCEYTAEEERDFVRDYLGPTMKKHYPNVKILIWDHNRNILVERGDIVLKDKVARKYVWGSGVHWYVSEDFSQLGKLHELHPDKHLLFTEGCIEGGVHLGDWTTGERYARNMIGDFRNFCEGYLDWNLTLNEIGGPNHVGNYCDAPIVTDTLKQTLYLNSSYYYIGHFSKYIQPGSIRITSDSKETPIKHVAFLNPDYSVVCIVLNETETDYHIQIKIKQDKEQFIIQKRSISTFIYKEDDNERLLFQ